MLCFIKIKPFCLKVGSTYLSDFELLATYFPLIQNGYKMRPLTIKIILLSANFLMMVFALISAGGGQELGDMTD